jgi:hypothetical protein
MRTYLRPTALARYLDLAPQRISQLVNRGVLDPPGQTVSTPTWYACDIFGTCGPTLLPTPPLA